MSQTNQKSFKYLYSILAIALLVAILGYAWYSVSHRNAGDDQTGHDAHEQESQPVSEKGPHGGKLLRDGSFALEVKIFETGVEPQLRLYAFDNNKPIPPSQFSANVTVKRLDTQEQLRFKPEADYLLGDQIVYEPHSF